MLDLKDREIIHALSGDARMPLKELARRVGLSSPSTSERLRRLQERSVIRAFSVEVDPSALGYALEAVVRIKPLPGRLAEVQKLLLARAELSECVKVTGDDCFIARTHVRSISELDGILDRIAEKAETITAIVKSTLIRRRLPPL